MKSDRGDPPQSCQHAEGKPNSSLATAQMQLEPQISFGEVAALVNRKSQVIVLSDAETGACIAVWPARQGRVLTSSVNGPGGFSFGWVNHDLIASGEILEHVNSVGGEDRIWLGPEGGQYSIYFAPGVPFDLDHWYTPAALDTEPFDVADVSQTSVKLSRSFHLENYSGAKFHLRIDREVRLLSQDGIWGALGVAAVEGVRVVGFESENSLTNLDDASWSKRTGLLSLWVLGQFQSTAQTAIILPIRPGQVRELGIPVTTNYFGTVPEDRISVREDAVLFRADANFRSKLGLSPQRAKATLGSYDAENHLLTIVQYSQPAEFAEYVNSSWKMQSDPFNGDVANCYNDGPPATGGPQLGPFYELESSSPAVALKPGESVSHIQRTIHLVGSRLQLGTICEATLGVSLDDVQSFITRDLSGRR
jgi:hypothetical protein